MYLIFFINQLTPPKGSRAIAFATEILYGHTHQSSKKKLLADAKAAVIKLIKIFKELNIDGD